jgi:hypothetical protein
LKRYGLPKFRDQPVRITLQTGPWRIKQKTHPKKYAFCAEKTYSVDYVSTYPRQRWRGRALCGCQVGPTSFSLLPLLLPPSSLLLPIVSGWTEGNRRRRRWPGRLRPSPAGLRPPEETVEQAAPVQQGGGARGAPKHAHPRPWRTAARASVVSRLRALRGEGEAAGRIAGGLGSYWC